MNFRLAGPGLLWRGLSDYTVRCISDRHAVCYRAAYAGQTLGTADNIAQAQKLCEAHHKQQTVSAYTAAWAK